MGEISARWIVLAACLALACDDTKMDGDGGAAMDARATRDGTSPFDDADVPGGDASVPPDRSHCARAVAARADDRPLLPAPSAAPPEGLVRTLFVVPATGFDYADVRSMQTHLKGFGFTGDWIFDSAFASAELGTYSSIAILGSAWVSVELSDTDLGRLANAMLDGTDVLWMGPGLPSDLGPFFGVRVEADATTGASMIRFTGTGGRAVETASFDEYVTRLRLDGAEAIATFEPGGLPAMTAYRRDSRYGRAICIPFGVMHYWSEALEPDAWARAELVYDAFSLLHSRGTVMLAPFPNGHPSAFLVRFEDMNPGGSRYNTHDEAYLDRFHRVVEELGAMGIAPNLGVVARYADPAMGESFAWNDPSIGRARLRAAIQWAIDEHGAEILSHGLTHQYGTREDDYTGVDWEFSDDATGTWIYLPYDEARMRIEMAREILRNIFGVTPRVWETPHLDGNEDTYRAAADAGYAIINEGDGHLFPNRFGYDGLIADRALNVPHTASYVPLDEGEALEYLDAAALSMLPRLVRIGAPFFLFYHGFVWGQENAMMRLAECADECDLWKPTISEMADWWVMRESAQITARLEGASLHASVASHPAGATLRFRLPDGQKAVAALVGGSEAPFVSYITGGIAYAEVVLESAAPAQVEVRFAP